MSQETSTNDSAAHNQDALDALSKRAEPDTPELIVGPESDIQPDISVVMPTLNEEEGIATCIEWIHEAVAELERPTEIIISDSSTDRTPEIARDLGAQVVTPGEPGYGYAYQYAFDAARGEYIVMGDADTTYDFREIPRLLSCITDGDADIVMGSRLEGRIKDGAMPPLHQYIGNPLLTRFLNLFYDAGVSDAHSGFRVFTREVIEELALDSDGMEFASEMVMRAGARGYQIEEVPITYHEREGEATLDSFEDGWRHLKFMLTNAPSYLYFVPGMVLLLVGGLLSGLAMFDVELFEQGFGPFSLVYGSLLVTVGLQAVFFGVFTDLATDPIRSTQDRVSKALHDHMTLERGLAVGAVAFTSGGVLSGYYISRWFASGFSRLPSLSAGIISFVGITMGLQIILYAFFFSVLQQWCAKQPKTLQ